MESVQVYFDLSKEDFSLDTANAVVQAFVEKYGRKVLRNMPVSQLAQKLYNDGKGEGLFLYNLPYRNLIIEAQTNANYKRIPPDKLYVCMSAERVDFRNDKSLNAFVEDSVRMYYVLKPRFAAGDSGSMFSGDGIHFLWGPSLYDLMLFSPELVEGIGLEKIIALEGQVHEVRKLKDGGVMIWLKKGDVYHGEGTPFFPLDPLSEQKICHQLGLKPRGYVDPKYG